MTNPLTSLKNEFKIKDMTVQRKPHVSTEQNRSRNSANSPHQFSQFTHNITDKPKRLPSSDPCEKRAKGDNNMSQKENLEEQKVNRHS